MTLHNNLQVLFEIQIFSRFSQKHYGLKWYLSNQKYCRINLANNFRKVPKAQWAKINSAILESLRSGCPQTITKSAAFFYWLFSFFQSEDVTFGHKGCRKKSGRLHISMGAQARLLVDVSFESLHQEVSKMGRQFSVGKVAPEKSGVKVEFLFCWLFSSFQKWRRRNFVSEID